MLHKVINNMTYEVMRVGFIHPHLGVYSLRSLPSFRLHLENQCPNWLNVGGNVYDSAPTFSQYWLRYRPAMLGEGSDFRCQLVMEFT